MGAQLEEMQKAGAHTSSADITTIMTVGVTTDTRPSTGIDDESIASGTYITSTPLTNTMHAHIVTLPTLSLATYGITLMASRQLRRTSTIPPTSLQKPLLNQIPSITRVNADGITPAKDTCIIYSREF